MQLSFRFLALAPLAWVVGCGEPASPRQPVARASDKAALFGDASLVPTREGERARREVALSQEIEQALDVLPSVARARVDVELPERSATAPARGRPVVAGEPETAADARARAVVADAPGTAAEARVLAVVVGEPGTDADALTSRVQAVARTVVGPAAAIEVVAETVPAPPPAPPAEPLRWPLLFGVLGLGFFGGTLLERLRALRRVTAVRRRA